MKHLTSLDLPQELGRPRPGFYRDDVLVLWTALVLLLLWVGLGS